MATERITIVVSQTGAVSVKKDIEGVGTAAKGSASGVDSLKAALAAYIGLQAAQKVAQLADAGTRLTNTLKQAGLSGQGLVDEQTKLFDLATANGQSVNELAGIYQKLTATQSQLGASGDDVNKVLAGIAASMKLSSGSADDQARALLQLSQVFGGLMVQSQDYNSLIDNAYPLLQAVANGSDRFRGSVSALSAAVRNSSVTSKEFFEALLKGSDANIALAASFNLTIGQALTNFNTKLIQGVLALNNATGAFSFIANAINFAAQNLGVLLALLTPLIGALTVLATQVIYTQLVGAFTAANAALGNMISLFGKLGLALLANPFTVFLAALVIVLGYFTDWQAAIQVTIQLYGALKYAIDSLSGASNEQLLADVKIVLDAKQAAADIVASGEKLAAAAKAAINGGAQQGAPQLKKAVVDGGSQAGATIAGEIARGVGNAAVSLDAILKDQQTRAVAAFNSANGVAAKVLGDSVVDGAKDGGNYIYNQVTGAVTKGAGDVQAAMQTGGSSAATSVQQALTSGGQSAAQSLTIAGQTVSGNIASALQASALFIASQIRSLLSAQTAQAVASAAKDRADARSTLAGIDPHHPGGSGSSGGSSGADGGGSGGASYQYTGPGSAIWMAQQFKGNVNGLVVPGASNSNGNGVTIVNQNDPNNSLTAINTQAGNRTVVNVIKDNAPEVRAILGIN